MDPFTHALLGASAAQLAFGRRLPRRAWLVGAGAGLAPDLDFFIRSASDPLLNIELHRQFTHALAFIPIGGALTGLPWLLRRRARADWRPVLGAATLAYATHGLLDACTCWRRPKTEPARQRRTAPATITESPIAARLPGLLGWLSATSAAVSELAQVGVGANRCGIEQLAVRSAACCKSNGACRRIHSGARMMASVRKVGP